MSNQPIVNEFGLGPISCHAFNQDRSELAVCFNSNVVSIFRQSGGSWTLSSTLAEHDKPVTSIDWAPKSNRIVTCSQDRNAYVWTLDGQKQWKPTLVLLRINRAATFVRWSPEEDKFAVASGSRCISVCYFEEDNDWWVGKHIKKPIRSTVLSLDWHPNNVLLAAGCADMKARVFSAFIKGIDKKPAPTPWGEKLPFNTVCGEFSSGSGGWIHGVAFSPDGNSLAFTGHDSTITVVDQASGSVQTIRAPYLPYVSVLWLNESQIVAAGHDCAPHLFEKKGNEWSFSASLDSAVKKADVGTSARDTFRRMASRAQATATNDTEVHTHHQNTINSIRAFSGSRDHVEQFSTSGIDGKLVIWGTGLSRGMGNLHL
ncbi:actin related protein 2/3 complex, subunit 1A/1B [Entomortierella parvispora]|uniref:Actin-related protein 2/3 complex subunit n=1 Tax=Entomortierella parvispora TaxID=205924 RepID=A0A9P3LWB1_9FUNG|nr:actin related protein 2/3 complex, subunit 1A/1B [Entomortierella parvispora]